MYFLCSAVAENTRQRHKQWQVTLLFQIFSLFSNNIRDDPFKLLIVHRRGWGAHRLFGISI